MLSRPSFTRLDVERIVPQTVYELWEGFAELDKNTPLEIEVLKEWEQDDVVCRIFRYQVGVFKETSSRVAAFPKGGTKLPALVEIHGGGQSASLNGVVTYAKRGYAGISINWGGNPVPRCTLKSIATDPKVTDSLANWQLVTEFSMSPSGVIVRDGQKAKVDGHAWQGPKEIRDLHWEGGEYAK